MTFSEINYTSEQQIFLTHLKDIGVVLETVILTPHEPVVDVYETSRSAAISGMKILATRYELNFQKINLELNINDYFNIRIIDRQEPKGQAIDFNTFVGPVYQFDDQGVTLFSCGTNRKAIYSEVTEGLVYALINTPHGLRLPTVRRPKHTSGIEHNIHLKTDLFKSFLATILSVKVIADTNFLSIFSWSTDWSNYFDDGKEWWGEFCWTIYNCKENTFIFIAASTTD